MAQESTTVAPAADAAEVAPVPAAEPTQKRVAKTAARKKAVRAPKTPRLHYANVGFISWTENGNLILSGLPVKAMLQVQGVHIGYSLFTRIFNQSFMFEPFAEVLNASIADKNNDVDFRQAHIPVYGAGLQASWLFLTRSTGTSMGLTTRVVYRLADLEKPTSEDTYDERTRLIVSEELSFGWAISKSWAFTHSIGYGINSPGMSLQAGLRWRFL